MRAMAALAPGSGYLARDGAVSRRWSFAAAMGLVTATFSTIAVVLGAGRFGRDVQLSWMEVGMVLLRDAGISATPTAGEVAAGVAVHGLADFFWALVFFGVLGPRARRLGPPGLLAVALATAAVEYYAVPPWLQPWLAMQTPYRVAAMVHTASALAYPLAFWLAGPLLGDRRWSGFGRGSRGRARPGHDAGGRLGGVGRGPPGARLALDRAAGRQRGRTVSSAHGRASRRRRGVGRAGRCPAGAPRMRTLGRLMVAEQQAEAESLRRWWENLYGLVMPAMAPELRVLQWSHVTTIAERRGGGEPVVGGRRRVPLGGYLRTPSAC